MKLKGIDVSHHQGVIDWNKVKGQIDYAILSVGYGDDIASQDDKQFHRNAKECTRLGIPFGVYIYSYAMNLAQAKSEADHTLRMIKGYKLDYPVYYDLEDAGTTGKCSNKVIADMAEVFCNVIENAGYWAGIYANTSWFNNKLTDSRFSRWVKWVAQYNTVCTYTGKHDMWQYASDGKVNGISGNVDMNYCYVDYPTLINSRANASRPIEPKPINEKVNVTYQVYTNRWLPDVVNLNDYAEKYGYPISGLYANSSKGELKYRVHTVNGDWLSWVIDRQDYAGLLDKNIYGLQMELIGLPGYSVKYRTCVGGRWLSWVADLNDYAGLYGQPIEGIQVQIIKK